MRLLAIYGLTGAGKSTACDMLVDACRSAGLGVGIVKLAEPLYRLQSEIYALAGRPITAGQQDQALLRDLARHLRRINPTCLVEDFMGRVDRACAAGVEIVVNDDLKDTEVDYPVLVERGFKLLHITCPDDVRARRLAARTDVTQAPETERTWRFDRIDADWTIDNNNVQPTQLRAQIDALVAGWLS